MEFNPNMLADPKNEQVYWSGLCDRGVSESFDWTPLGRFLWKVNPKPNNIFRLLFTSVGLMSDIINIFLALNHAWISFFHC